MRNFRRTAATFALMTENWQSAQPELQRWVEHSCQHRAPEEHQKLTERYRKMHVLRGTRVDALIDRLPKAQVLSQTLFSYGKPESREMAIDNALTEQAFDGQ